MAQAKSVAGVSEDELKGLSAEERAALAEEEDDVDGLADVAGEGGDDEAAAGAATGKKDVKAAADDKDKGDEEDEPAPKKAADDTAAADAAAAAAAKSDADKKVADGAAKAETEGKAATPPADDEPAPSSQRYVAAPVEKFDEQIKTLGVQLADVGAQFKAGDIELEEYQAKQQEILSKRDTLRDAKLKAEISAEFNEQAEERDWRSNIATFMRETRAAEGIDYRAGEIEVGGKKLKLMDALDSTVKALGFLPEHADKPQRWFLDEAHAIVKARYGLTGAKPKPLEDASAAAAKKEAARKEGEKRKPDVKGLPRTLGGLPAAEDDDASGDPEFAHLDKLDGIDLEVAVARLTPEQQERWART